MTTFPPAAPPPGRPGVGRSDDPDGRGDEVRVRVHGPGDLVAALPALLGYHARDSIVLVVFGGASSRIRLTLRLDIPEGAEVDDADTWRAVADALRSGAGRANGEQAILIVLDGDDDLGAALSRQVRQRLGVDGLTLLDTVVVNDGRYRSVECADSTCCPSEGRPVPPSSALVAAAVSEGRVIHADREDLAAELAAPDDDDAERSRMVTALLTSTLAHGSIGLDGDDIEALLDHGCAQAGRGRLGLADAVRLAMVLTIGEIRDQAYAHMLTVGAHEHRVLWGSVCRQVHPEIAAAPLALAALAAYLCGAGTLATIAIERAREVDACHASVSLVSDILLAGIPPRLVRDALARSVLDDR
jgi:hypothetical protein